MVKKYLIFGGTDGIGKQTAILLSRKGAKVEIIGRSQVKADSVLQEMEGEKSFAQLDVTDAKAVQSYCNQQKDRIDGILLAAGGLNYGPRRETKDGVEVTLSQNYLSRFQIIHSLLPLLEGSRVITCLGAGNGSTLDTEDWQLKNSGYAPFFIRAASQHATMGDVMVREFAKRHPATNFTHFFPGVVNTQSAVNQGFPRVLTFFSGLVMPYIATDPKVTAEIVVKMLTEDTYSSKEGLLVGQKGEIMKPNKSVLEPEIGDKLWDFSVGLINKITA